MKACEVIVMEPKFNQLCVWTATTLDGYSKEDLEQFFRDEFSCRIKFAEEVVTLPCLEKNEEGGKGMTCFSTFMMMILVDLLSSGFYMEYVGGKTFLAMVTDINIQKIP